jgi:NTE family protein
MTKTVGISLGGGGAKGLAHIAVLQAIDELGIDVVAISGTSIGAIIGTLYASGKSGNEIRSSIDELLAMPSNLEEVLNSKRLFGWLDLLDIELGRNHLLQADAFVSLMSEYLGVENFEQLKIPMSVVAADFWNRSEVVFESGPIAPAVSASFCLPGVFKPVVIEDRVLVDGGCVNPVPFDLIRDQCDILIAVDVLGKRVPGDDLMPSYSEALFNTFQIAEATIVKQKLKSHPPDLYLEPAISDVKMLDFQKSEQVYEQMIPECERLTRELQALLLEP